MGLRAETKKIADITLVRASGWMTVGETDAFRGQIRELLDEGVRKLILELSAIDQIDSVGGVTLIRCFFEAREAEARICVSGASPCVVKLFKDTEIATLIPFFPTMEVALEYFAAKASGRIAPEPTGPSSA